MSIIENLLDENGNFKLKGFDPYRKPDDDPEYDAYWNSIFYGEDDKWYTYGSVKDVVMSDLRKLITEKKWSPFCDAVMLFYAEEHGANTKGSYPAIYMWR